MKAKEQWHEVKCNSCNSDNYEIMSMITKKDTFRIVRCRLCGLVYMNPQFIDDKMYQTYPKDEWSNRDDRGVAKSKWVIYRKRLNHLEKFVKGKRLLDIGCAFGSFIGYAKEIGWDACGIEVSKQASNYCNTHGMEVYCGTLEKLRLPKNHFDVITMFDVLEHMPDPMTTLNKCRSLLRKDGILVIETGNVDSLHARIKGKKWEYYG